MFLVLPCDRFPCTSSFTRRCVNVGQDYRCLCIDGYRGRTCRFPIRISPPTSKYFFYLSFLHHIVFITPHLIDESMVLDFYFQVFISSVIILVLYIAYNIIKLNMKLAFQGADLESLKGKLRIAKCFELQLVCCLFKQSQINRK